MKKLLSKIFLFFLTLFIGCKSTNKQLNNRSTTEEDLKYYNLKYSYHEDDNGTAINIAIPKEFQKSDARACR